jgi:hypothetical protein
MDGYQLAIRVERVIGLFDFVHGGQVFVYGGAIGLAGENVAWVGIMKSGVF